MQSLFKWLLSRWKCAVTNHHASVSSHVRETWKRSLIYSVPGLGLSAQLANENVTVLQLLKGGKSARAGARALRHNAEGKGGHIT